MNDAQIVPGDTYGFAYSPSNARYVVDAVRSTRPLMLLCSMYSDIGYLGPVELSMYSLQARIRDGTLVLVESEFL